MSDAQPHAPFWKRIEQRGERLSAMLLIYAVVVNAAGLVFELFLGTGFLPLPDSFEPALLSIGTIVIVVTAYFWFAARLSVADTGNLNQPLGRSRRYWFAYSRDGLRGRPVPVTWEGWVVLALVSGSVVGAFLLIRWPDAPVDGFQLGSAVVYLAALVAIPAFFLKTQPRRLNMGSDQP